MVPAQVQVLSERQRQGLLSEYTANLALLGCLLQGSCPRPGSSSEAWSLDRALPPHCHRIFPNHSSLRPFSRLKHRRVSTGLGRRFSSSALLLCSTGNTLKKTGFQRCMLSERGLYDGTGTARCDENGKWSGTTDLYAAPQTGKDSKTA